MAAAKPTPTGRESPFHEDEFIVTKTDLKGRLTYANDVFLRVSRFQSGDVIGQPHSIIRHPEMPRSIFNLLWERIEAKREIFAYVVNLASNGDHYWVLAHVTPSFDATGTVVGYHSNRRKPNPSQIDRIRPLYAELLDEERRPSNRKDGMTAARDRLDGILARKGMGYDEFVLTL